MYSHIMQTFSNVFQCSRYYKIPNFKYGGATFFIKFKYLVDSWIFVSTFTQTWSKIWQRIKESRNMKDVPSKISKLVSTAGITRSAGSVKWDILYRKYRKHSYFKIVFINTGCFVFNGQIKCDVLNF